MGLLRYAALLSVGGDDYCIFDIKQAVHAIAPRYQHVSMPRVNASRVVEGARQITPALGERMIATRFLEHGVFIRELLPQDLKLELDQMSIEEAIHMSSYLAYVVGCAHAKQMDDGTRKSWLSELKLNRSKSLDTHACVVRLLGSHEAGYLEHCRKYALRLDGY